MRPEVEQQKKQIETSINIDALQVEKADTIGYLIEVLEEKLFIKKDDVFVPALHLHEDKKNGIGENEVARDKDKIALYEEVIQQALDKIEDLIAEAVKADAFGKQLKEDFPKKTDSIPETIDKLYQLHALLQSYLDLFKEWELGSNSEAPMEYKEATQKLTTIEKKLNEVLIGQKDAVRLALVALVTKGHVLLETNSGMGKTRFAKSLGKILGLKSARIQGRPDLMPDEILGFTTHDQTSGKSTEKFKKGPAFTNVLLCDELNRTTPKTQAALLEAMEEKQVTNGKAHELPRPFFVIATQNNSDDIGTYPLPRAELDRFQFIVHMDLPSSSTLSQITRSTLTGGDEEDYEQLASVQDVLAIQKTVESIAVPSNLIDYVSTILVNTHPEKTGIESVRRYVDAHASIRAEHAILRGAKAGALMDGRTTVSIKDIQDFIRPALQHRIKLNFEGLSRSDVSIDTIIDDIISGTMIA